MFQKATRRKAKLKLTITGPSGSGKTYSALKIAKGIGGKIAVIDTENDSASLYADQEGMPEFDTTNLRPPYTTVKYMQAMSAAATAGYDIVIIDSGTHQWAGEGGILSRKEKLDQKPGSNSYTNWGQLTPEQEMFKAAILQAPIHMIMTLRSKQDYVLEKNEKGKSSPVKVGMAPIQRDGMEYEFTTVFDVDMSHNATVSKDRTGLFDGKYFTPSEETGRELAEWLLKGQEAKAVTTGLPPVVIAKVTPAAQANPPRTILTPQVQPTKAPEDMERQISMEEFNELKRVAHQHLWSGDQFYDCMRKKYNTVVGPALRLKDMIEFKQVIVSMNGAQATAEAGVSSGPAQLRGPVITLKPTIPQSPPNPEETPPPKDEDFPAFVTEGIDPLNSSFESFSAGLHN